MHALGIVIRGPTATPPIASLSGIGVFVLCLGIAVADGCLDDPGLLMAVAIRGSLLGVVVTGVMTLTTSCVQCVHRQLLDGLFRPIGRWRDRQRGKRARRCELKQRKIEEARLLEEQRLAAPQQRQAAELARRKNAIAHTEQLHRDQVRFDVRLFYDRYRRELADLLPEDKFDAYFQSFLTDATDANVFQQRAERLKDMIRERLELSSRKQQAGFETIDEVITYYDEKRRMISQLPVDDEVREDFLMQLDESMERDLREFL